MLLVHIKKYYEGTTGEEVPTDQYDALHISPVHIHKNKISHKKAILALGDEVVHHIRSHHDPYIEHRHDVHSDGMLTNH